MTTLLILPAGIAWLLAAVIAPLDGRRPLWGWLAATGLGASLLAAVLLLVRVLYEGPVEVVAGGWPEGVGITLRADVLGASFAAVSLAVVLVAFVHEVLLGVRSRTFPALVLFLAAGLSGLFLTGDIFNFYVFFEISMTASYILTGYREENSQMRAAFIFAVVNLLGSVMFLSGIAGLYHVTGSLDMEVVAGRIGQVEPSSIIPIATVIFVAFSLKLGLFPFHFWLPAVYVGSHAPVAAILSGAVANIGSYGLLRFGADVLPDALEFGAPVVLVLGVASIVYGAMQAVSRHDTSEVMAYSTIGQVGYILVALAVGGPVGYAAAVVYAIVNSLNKALVFLAAQLRGPLAGAAFAVGAFSIAGVPPAVGFVGKIALFQMSIEAGGILETTALVALIFAGSALSFVYAFQVYQRAFLAREDGNDRRASPRATRVLAISLAAFVLAVGLWPEPLLVLGEESAILLLEGLR
ncbi:proton-conducting transporter membrane subunit [soil metagenome]